MSVDVDTRPWGLDDQHDDPGLTHVVCCDPDRSLCGEDLGDADWAADEEPIDCVVCADRYGGTFGKPFCRLRQWWRARWSR